MVLIITHIRDIDDIYIYIYRINVDFSTMYRLILNICVLLYLNISIYSKLMSYLSCNISDIIYNFDKTYVLIIPLLQLQV